MKKLFTLLTALVLCSSMSWAQEKAAPRKATQATYEQSFSWDEFTSITNPDGGSNWTRCHMMWYRGGSTSERPALRLVFVVRDADHLTINGKYAPQYGTYTLSSSQPTFNTCFNAWTNYESLFYPDNQKTYYLESGTVTVSKGHRRNDTKPYIVVNSTSNANSSGNIVTSGNYITSLFTIGEPLYTYNIVAATSNSSFGTAQASKSSVEEDGQVTLTATETNGLFQGWSLDGGNTIISGTSDKKSYTVTLDADAGYNGQTFTYTAVFIPASGGTITVNADGLGTVTGSGTYSGGANVSLTATPATDYMFVMWKKDGSATNLAQNCTVLCSGDATYTAVFKRKYQVTATSSDDTKGTVSISPAPVNGYYYDGQQITITATAANKLCQFDNWADDTSNTNKVRVVTVSGNASYTANFSGKEAIQIIDNNGLVYDGSGYGFFEGKTSTHCFHFESYNAQLSLGNYTAIDQDYTKLFISGSWTNQKAIDFSSMEVNISKENIASSNFNNMFLYVFESTFNDVDGQLYYVKIKAIGPMKADQVNTNSNVNWTSDPGTLSSNVSLERVSGTNRWRLKARGGNWSGYSYGYDTQIDFVVDDADLVSGFIPTGVYPISYTGESKSVAMPEYPSLNYSSSYDKSTYNTAVNGSYARLVYLGSYGSVSQLWWYMLCGGTVTVSKSGSTYSFAINAISSAANPNVSNPSAYYTVKYNVGGVQGPAATTYKITFNNYDGSQIKSSDVEENAKPTCAEPTRTATAQYTYTFAGWKNGDNVYTSANLPVATADVAYTAQFDSVVRQYTITINPASNGTITVMNGFEEVKSDDKVEYGTILTLSQASDGDCYSFDDWTIDGNYQPYEDEEGFSPDAPRRRVEIEDNDEPGGTVGGGGDGPEELEEGGSEDIQIEVQGDLIISATFMLSQYTIHITAPQHGTLTVMNGSDEITDGGTVDCGTELTITATPASGYEFGEWQEDGAASVTVDGNKTIAVTFNPMPVSVTLNEVAYYYKANEDDDFPTAIVTGVMSVTDGTNTYTYDEEDDENTFEFHVGDKLTFTIEATEQVYDYAEFADKDENVTNVGKTWTVTLGEDDMDVYGWCGISSVTWEDKAPTGYDDYMAYFNYMMSTYADKPIRRLYLGRSFGAKNWGTLCLPIRSMSLSRASIQQLIYGLQSATTNNAKTVVTIKFVKATVMETGKPYMFLSNSEVKTPYFEYLTLDANATAQYEQIDGENVKFVGVLNENVLLGKGDRSVRYVAGNKMYYPSSTGNGVTMTPDRAYFKITDFPSQAPMRVRLMVEDEIIEDVLENEVEVTKYIENGNLIIERNGIRYTAIGATVE